jgi:hypothetical protein
MPEGRAVRQSTLIGVAPVDLAELFDPLDSGPLERRALAPNVDAHLLEQTRRTGADQELSIRVLLPAAAIARAGERVLGDAVAHHLACAVERQTAALGELMRTGWRFLAMSMALLMMCMWLGYLVRTRLLPEPYGSFMEQAISVIGWVANWRPLEMLLYERWTQRRTIGLYQRLARAPIVIAARPDLHTELD